MLPANAICIASSGVSITRIIFCISISFSIKATIAQIKARTILPTCHQLCAKKEIRESSVLDCHKSHPTPCGALFGWQYAASAHQPETLDSNYLTHAICFVGERNLHHFCWLFSYVFCNLCGQNPQKGRKMAAYMAW
jgi:hypothetical protein